MTNKKSLGSPREVRPRRTRWGQHFLRDRKILKKIVDFAQIEKGDTVIEVGPGEGTLTELLLERAGKVMAIEKDEKMAERLERNFKYQISNNKLVVINWDILDIENYLKITKLKIKNYILVGNIPYYITGALFKKFLENPPAGGQPKSITFVVQKEVAERIMGSHFAKASRDKKESILSISIKAYGKPEYGGIIKAGSFYPKPKIDSAIIAIRNVSKERFEKITPLTPLILRGEEDKKKIEEKFFKILKAGFAHKRKKLIRNLEKMSKGTFWDRGSSKVPLDILKEIFEKSGLSEKARAENLKTEDWICLTKELA